MSDRDVLWYRDKLGHVANRVRRLLPGAHWQIEDMTERVPDGWPVGRPYCAPGVRFAAAVSTEPPITIHTALGYSPLTLVRDHYSRHGFGTGATCADALESALEAALGGSL